MKAKALILWPVSIRILHWAIALIIVLDAFFVEDEYHEWMGYAAAAFVLVRLCFGLWGKGAVHFRSFPLGPGSFKAFIKGYLNCKPVSFEGHNPPASLVYLMMWSLLIGLAITGYMMGLDAFWGDETLESIHETFSNILIGLSVIHLCGILLDAWMYKRKTWMGMINGRRD